MRVHASGVSPPKIGGSGRISWPGMECASKSSMRSGRKTSIAAAFQPRTPSAIRSCLASGFGRALRPSSASVIPCLDVPKSSMVACSSKVSVLGTHSRGRSRNQGLCGGGSDVLYRTAIAFACSQFGRWWRRNSCQRLRTWNCSFGSSASSG